MTLDVGRFDRTRFLDNGFLFQPANTAIRLPLESLPCASSSAFVVAHWSVPPLRCNLRLILSPDSPHFGSSSAPLRLTPAHFGPASPLYLGSSSAQPHSRLISAQLASVASLRHSSLHFGSATAFTRLDRHESLHTRYWHLPQ